MPDLTESDEPRAEVDIRNLHLRQVFRATLQVSDLRERRP
jgi:hypothetical protein